MTSAEFTEWQAFYELEPFGELVADQRHGVATALQANAHFGSGAKKSFVADDFIHWRRSGPREDGVEPVLLDDAAAQSNLIRASMFGLPPK